MCVYMCVRVCGQVHAHGSVHVLVHRVMHLGMCVFMKESTGQRHAHWHLCVLVFMRRCLCMVVDGTQSLSPEITDVEWAVLGRLGRESRTAVGLTGGGMGPGLLGLRAHRMQGLQAGGSPQACQQHQWDLLPTRAVGKAMPCRTPLVTWLLLAQHSRTFLLQEQSLAALRRAGGAGCPQLGGDLVSAGLLVTSLFLCLEGVKKQTQCSQGDDRAGPPLPWRWCASPWEPLVPREVTGSGPLSK